MARGVRPAAIDSRSPLTSQQVAACLPDSLGKPGRSPASSAGRSRARAWTDRYGRACRLHSLV